MVQEAEIKMLENILKNRRAFRRFYQKGYFVHDEGMLEGMIAIFNNKSLLSYMKDKDDDERVVATARIKDRGLVIYKIFGKNFFSQEIGNINPDQIRYENKKEIVSKKIDTIYECCKETKENRTLSIFGNIKKKINREDKKMSKKEAKELLEETIKQLNKINNLDEKKKVVPKVDVNMNQGNGKSINNEKVNDNRESSNTKNNNDDSKDIIIE